MFCRNCGKELSDGAFMCPDCGEPVSKETKGNTLSGNPDGNKVEFFAVAGFTGALVSVACWVFYLVLFLCGYHYLIPMSIIMGVVTSFICLTSLLLSIKGLITVSAPKNRAFALTGVILSALFFTGFAMLTCLAGVLF